MPSADGKRTRSTSDQTNILSKKRHSTRNGGKAVVTNIAVRYSDTTIERPPHNPQACFTGLPAELRLEIYSLLRDTIIIHVHRRQERKRDLFTWTPCRASNAISPLLCANPKWSGMCSEDERCTYKLGTSAVLRGAWALAASNKMIRNEAQEMFFRDSVFSVRAQNLEVWLDHLAMMNPRHLDRLQRVTLNGPNEWRSLSRIEFEILRNRAPNLRSLGVQCQSPVWQWFRNHTQSGPMLDYKRWHEWSIVDFVRDFDPAVTVAFEAMVWKKPHPSSEPDGVEQQIAIRIMREGKRIEKASDSSWTEEDTEVDVAQSDQLAPCGNDAKWQQWWHNKGRGFTHWTVLSPPGP